MLIIIAESSHKRLKFCVTGRMRVRFFARRLGSFLRRTRLDELPQGPAIVGLHVSFADRDGLA